MISNSEMLGWLAGDALILAVALCIPRLRAKMRQFLLGARTLYVETPLRLVTGRRRPDRGLIGPAGAGAAPLLG